MVDAERAKVHDDSSEPTRAVVRFKVTIPGWYVPVSPGYRVQVLDCPCRGDPVEFAAERDVLVLVAGIGS